MVDMMTSEVLLDDDDYGLMINTMVCLTGGSAPMTEEQISQWVTDNTLNNITISPDQITLVKLCSLILSGL